jgi:hypothetical protein
MRATIFGKYRVFQRNRQAKFAYSGSILKLKPIVSTAPDASKNEAHFESGQNQLRNNYLVTSI